MDFSSIKLWYSRSNCESFMLSEVQCNDIKFKDNVCKDKEAPMLFIGLFSFLY